MIKTLYLLAFTIGTCFGQESKIELNSFFTQTEIRDLNAIADFFQEQLCGTNGSDEFENCLSKSLPNLIDLEKSYIGEKINYRKQKKLYKKISKSTFDKIWAICKNWIKKPKYEYKSICFSGDKAIIDFESELGKSNPYIKYCSEKLKNVGSFDDGNYLAVNIRDYPNNWNLDDRNVQIFIAVHFLTQNDRLKRDKKAIRLEKNSYKN